MLRRIKNVLVWCFTSCLERGEFKGIVFAANHHHAIPFKDWRGRRKELIKVGYIFRGVPLEKFLEGYPQ
jgi:hypothetical protein